MNKTRRRRTKRATQVARTNGSQSRKMTGITIFRLFVECTGNLHHACTDCKYITGENCIYPEYSYAFNTVAPVLDDDQTGYEVVAQYPGNVVNRICQDERNWHGMDYRWTTFAIERLNQWQRF